MSKDPSGFREREFSDQTRNGRPRLLRIAAKLVGPEVAEDIVQLALLRTWRDRDHLSGHNCFIRYATTVTRTAAIDYLRERARKPSSQLDESAEVVEGFDRSYEVPPDPARVAESSDDLDHVVKVLRGMDRSDARILYERYGLAFGYKELATNSGVPEDQLKGRLRDALRIARRRSRLTSWVGTAPWAVLYAHGFKVKSGIGGISHGALVATGGAAAAIGITVAVVAVLGGHPSETRPDTAPVALIQTVSSPTPFPTTSQPDSASAHPAPPTVPPTRQRAAPPPVAPPTHSPDPVAAPAPVLPTSAAPSPSATPSPTPVPTALRAVCATEFDGSRVVVWQLENNTNATYSMTHHSGLLDSPEPTFGPHSVIRWQQTEPPHSSSSWAAKSADPAHKTIGGALSSTEASELPRCGYPVYPAPSSASPAPLPSNS